jgi:hypothetical protein
MVSLTLSEAVLCLKEPNEKDIPREHRLDVSMVTRQALGVFSHLTRKCFIIKCSILLYINILCIRCFHSVPWVYL